MLYFKFLVDADIVTVSDICYEFIPGFLSFSAILEIVKDKRPDISITLIQNAYVIIRSSLPDEWVEIINTTVSNTQQKTITNICIPKQDGDIFLKDGSVKSFYSLFLETLVKEPTSYSYWSDYAIDINWKKVWATVNNKDKSSEQCELDFKICHNIIFTYEKLNKIGMADTNVCPVCKQDKEDMFHLFAFCDELYETIVILKSIFIDVYREGYSFNMLISWLMFGFQPNKKIDCEQLLNVILSIYRISVFKRRTIASLQNCNINLVKMFKCYVKHHFKLLWTHYKFRKQTQHFLQRYVMPLNLFSIENNQIIFKYPFED